MRWMTRLFAHSVPAYPTLIDPRAGSGQGGRQEGAARGGVQPDGLDAAGPRRMVLLRVFPGVFRVSLGCIRAVYQVCQGCVRGVPGLW